MDEKMTALMELVGDGIHADDERLLEFVDDRCDEPDTINLCIKAGVLRQIGNYDLDEFRLMPVR